MQYDEENWIPDHVGWIYLRFEHSLFWWELVNMFTKTTIGITERAGARNTTAQLVVTFITLIVSLTLHIVLRPYAAMMERGKDATATYEFTIMGTKRQHGVRFTVLPRLGRGVMIHDCNEDAKHRPESDDFKHHLRLEDKVIAIDGHELPHIYAHQKRKTIAAMFGRSKVDLLAQIDEQQKEVDTALKEIEADKDYDPEQETINETDDAVS